MPGFVDSHSHVVFAGDRVGEFAARMAGRPYSAGGIGSTVAATRQASDEELRPRATSLVAEAQRAGTTTIEIKSGYGLTADDEHRLLRIAAELTSRDDVPRRPRRARRIRRAGRRLRRPRVRRDARALRSACPLDRRLLRDRCIQRRAVPRRARGRPRAPGSACVCMPTSSVLARACDSPSSSAAPPSTTAPTSPTTTSTRWRERDRGDVPAGDRLLDPAAVSRRPARASTPASRWRSPPTATRGRATRRRWRSASPSPCAISA